MIAAVSVELAAYVLLGDTRWVRQSVLSYYDHVTRLVAIGDRHCRGWDGQPLSVEASAAAVADLDHENKVEFVCDDLYLPGMHPVALDTRARQLGLARARQHADWVLQIDLDEIVPCPEVLVQHVRQAAEQDADAVDFPSRWFMGKVGGRTDTYLEACSATWRTAAHYPGPLAVGPTATLNYARRAFARTYRVDIRKRNTYPEYTRDHPVHAVVPPREAVIHMSWVLPHEQLPSYKCDQYGHEFDFDMNRFRSYRAWRLRHPWLTTLGTPLRAWHGHPNRLRPCRLRIRYDTISYR